ncbi:voltage-gated potassium channel [Aureococcus anophagefferens]|nr:voltage-gated potassium channel [Aureococcus anophagefferens]
MGSGGRKTIVVEVSPGRPPSDSVDDDGLDEHDAARWRGSGPASGCSTDEDAPRHESETEDDGTLGSRTPGFLTEDEDEPAPRVTWRRATTFRGSRRPAPWRGASTPGGFSRADDDDEPGLVAVARLRRVERAAGPMTLFGLTSRLGAVHPNSAFKRRWDYLTSLLAVAVVFAPECRALAGWCLGLEEPRRPPADGPDAGLVAALVNVWFLCDVLLNFVTGYVDGAGVLVMSKRRIAIRYCQTYFLLDIWCALPFDRLVLPYLPVVEDLVATYDAAAPQLPCARGSDKTLLVDCVPRRGPIRRVRNVVRHARNWTPRALQFAKRRGRLRQVLVSAPNIVSYIVKTLRLVRISKVKLVNRDELRRSPSKDRLRRSASKEKLLGDIVAAAKRYETPRLQTARRRLKSTSARPAHQRSFSE